MPEQAGMPITAEQANQYLQRFVALRELMQKKADDNRQTAGTVSPMESLSNELYSSDVNAFIFSKNLIEDFFSDTDAEGKPQDKADYLMVILGAKENGSPTIVVAGVNKKKDGKTYRSLKRVYSADEQPPTNTLIEFPGSDDNLLTPTSAITII